MRVEAVSAALAVLAISGTCDAIIYSVDLQLINNLRASLRLKPLTMDSRLNGCAHFHALEQYQMGVMTHYSPNGQNWGDRMQRCLGFRPGYNGENVAVGYSYDANVFEAWKASPVHYANMVNPNYNAIGFGQEGTYWVQNFAQMSGADGKSGDGWWYVQPSPSPSPKPSPKPSPSPSPAKTSAAATSVTGTTSTTSAPAQSASPTLDYDPLHPPKETGVVLDADKNAYVVPGTIDVNGTTTGSGDDGYISYYAGDEDAIISREAKNALAKMSYEEREAYANALVTGEMNPFIIIESAAQKVGGVVASLVVACIVTVVLSPLL
ncbi:hypothetical protein BJ742DRAFT_840534 [Cladochytrium replicatum]|nr:hypothetical protein BJ742DRAFT_840534 [Cladochytrium replicatum]